MRGVALNLPRRRRTGSVCLVAFGMYALVFAPSASAQAVPNGAEANELVQVVKSGLIGIAIALLVLTIFYWIHTDPKRRARAHGKKQARNAAFSENRSTETSEPAEPSAGSDSADVVLLGNHAENEASAAAGSAAGVNEREVS